MYTDWTACRTSDRRGREGAMLAEPALVMEDLAPHPFPDVRTPLPEEQEEQLLMALAALHARCAADPGARAPLPDMPRLC